MRTLLVGLALCITCLAQPAELTVVVPASAAHPQNWLQPEFRNNPKPDYRGKSAGTVAEFVAPELISKIVVDQYAGDPADVRRYLTRLPTAVAQSFGPSLELCKPYFNKKWVLGAGLEWTSTSTVTFESGRSGKLSVATVVVSRAGGPQKVFGLSDVPNCVGFDKVPIDSLYFSYVDPDGYTWTFAVPLQSKN